VDYRWLSKNLPEDISFPLGLLEFGDPYTTKGNAWPKSTRPNRTYGPPGGLMGPVAEAASAPGVPSVLLSLRVTAACHPLIGVEDRVRIRVPDARVCRYDVCIGAIRQYVRILYVCCLPVGSR
jgi:hypothetical protein